MIPMCIPHLVLIATRRTLLSKCAQPLFIRLFFLLIPLQLSDFLTMAKKHDVSHIINFLEGVHAAQPLNQALSHDTILADPDDPTSILFFGQFRNWRCPATTPVGGLCVPQSRQ
jgi:hypothetical protein